MTIKFCFLVLDVLCIVGMEVFLFCTPSITTIVGLVDAIRLVTSMFYLNGRNVGFNLAFFLLFGREVTFCLFVVLIGRNIRNKAFFVLFFRNFFVKIDDYFFFGSDFFGGFFFDYILGSFFNDYVFFIIFDNLGSNFAFNFFGNLRRFFLDSNFFYDERNFRVGFKTCHFDYAQNG